MLNEAEIERRVERATDTLDRVFMSGGMTQAEYDREIRQLANWAKLALLHAMKGNRS